MFGQTLTEQFYLNTGNTAQLIFGQWVEHHYFIHTVNKLGTEMAADHIHHRRLHHLIVFFTRQHLNHIGAKVRGHNDNGIFKVYGAPLTIG